MSQWIERVRNHPVWALLSSTSALFDQALEREGIPSDQIDALERLKTVVSYCKKRLESTDPVLVLPAVLDALNNSLTQLNVNVTEFTSGGQFTQLAAANQQADAILASTVSIIGTITPNDFTMISESTASYRVTLEKALKNALAVQVQLTERNATNEAKIAAIEAAITTEQQRLATIISDQQSQFSAAQDKRASDFTATQAEFVTKFTTSSTEQQTQFSTDQDSRRSAFADFQRDSQQKVVILISEYDEKLKAHDAVFLNREKQTDETHKANLEALRVEYVEAASTILDAMRKHKSEIESLVGVIGNLGVTSGYKTIADHARKMLYIWQGITVSALIGLIFVASVIAFPNFFITNAKEYSVKDLSDSTGQVSISHHDVEPRAAQDAPGKSEVTKAEQKSDMHKTVTPATDSDFYHGLATRIFLSITFGIFAAYAGRQASRFFEIEQKNRKLALELEALGPFIEPLDKEDRDKFRVQIGDRSFGVPDHEALTKKDDDLVSVMSIVKSKEIQDAIVSQVKEAFKGLK